MKNTFFEFYKLDNETFKNIWERGLIIIDANILLNFYRYKEATKRQLFTILDKSKERIWLPHQVALEYHRNRIKAIKDQIKAYEDIKQNIEDNYKKLNCLDVFKKHSLIDVESIRNTISESIQKINDKLEEQKKLHPDYLKDDIVLNKVTLLYDGKVGKEYNDDDLKKIFKEGKARYESKTPPGYCDSTKKRDKPDIQLYGDLILWKQIIDIAKSTKKNIVFVTDDVKEDWWEIDEGKTIGPRKELIREFRIETGCNILIYKTDSFLREAKNHIDVLISDESIDDIVNTRKNNTVQQRSQNNEEIKIAYNILRNEIINKQISEIVNSKLKKDNSQSNDRIIDDFTYKMNLLGQLNTKFPNLSMGQILRIINSNNNNSKNDDNDDDVELVPEE